ncbi:MAG: pro-sigmaK processing inhibitor BofA [Firmicutes bacterium]|nr:pro-sigmaK processing inhibitor BofA [Bacillota bacterium]
MEWKYIIMALLGSLGILLMGSSVLRPLRLLLNLTVCFTLGAVFLVAFNLFLEMLGMHIGVNPFTALLAGALHLPGIVLLLILNYLFLN